MNPACLSSTGIVLSYGITVYNESEELERLLNLLIQQIDLEDEIIVLSDQSKVTPEVLRIIDQYKELTRHISYPLNDDFASFKNSLIKHASGNYLFQLDADEMPDEVLLKKIKQILYIYDKADCVFIPRVNYVNDLSEEYAQKRNWVLDEKKRVNFPDLQMRLFKLKKEIRWTGKIHETLVNCLNTIILPYKDTEDYCLCHSKTFAKQKDQNNYYDTFL